MAFKVIPEASNCLRDLSKIDVCLESDVSRPPFNAAFDELNSSEAKTYAQAYANQVGVNPAVLDPNSEAPFPVNVEGIPLDAIRDGQNQPLPMTDPRMQVARYRKVIRVHKKI